MVLEREEEEEEGAVSWGFEEVFEWQNENEKGFVRERERGFRVRVWFGLFMWLLGFNVMVSTHLVQIVFFFFFF